MATQFVPHSPPPSLPTTGDNLDITALKDLEAHLKSSLKAIDKRKEKIDSDYTILQNYPESQQQQQQTPSTNTSISGDDSTEDRKRKRFDEESQRDVSPADSDVPLNKIRKTEDSESPLSTIPLAKLGSQTQQSSRSPPSAPIPPSTPSNASNLPPTTTALSSSASAAAVSTPIDTQQNNDSSTNNDNNNIVNNNNNILTLKLKVNNNQQTSSAPGTPNSTTATATTAVNNNNNSTLTKSESTAVVIPQGPRRIPPGPGVADDFGIPTNNSVPQKPVSVPPQPTARHPFEVQDDFTNQKPTGTQVSSATFSSFVEQYLRSFGEDDLAFLAAKNEDTTPFDLPPLGRWYQDVWTEEDAALNTSPSQSPLPLVSTASGLSPPPLVRFKSVDLTEESLAKENIFIGPLSERLISSITYKDSNRPPFETISTNDVDDKSLSLITDNTTNATHTSSVVLQDQESQMLDQAENSLVTRPTTTTATTATTTTITTPKPVPTRTSPPLDAIDLEERIRRELRYLGVFSYGSSTIGSTNNPQLSNNQSLAGVQKDGDIDWTQRQDDEIASALRSCQRMLRDQIPVNEARKKKLSERVKDRMAYQEYEILRDALEKEVEAGWNKLQKAHKKKSDKKSGKPNAVTAAAAAATQNTPSTPQDGVATRASEKDKPVPETLQEALDKRERYIKGLAPFFDDAKPGKFRGIPENSIYEDDPLARVDMTKVGDAKQIQQLEQQQQQQQQQQQSQQQLSQTASLSKTSSRA